MRRIPISYLFFMGVFVGILIMYMGKSVWLDRTGLLCEGDLLRMQGMSVEKNALFYYVLKKRLGSAMVLLLLATTYLGVAVVFFSSVLWGIGFGMLLEAAILRYGLKGIWLLMVAGFPQSLLYVPAFGFLLLQCRDLCLGIYYDRAVKQQGAENGRGPLKYLHLEGRTKILAIIFLLLIAIFVGCFLESYVNPSVFLNFLRTF